MKYLSWGNVHVEIFPFDDYNTMPPRLKQEPLSETPTIKMPKVVLDNLLETCRYK